MKIAVWHNLPSGGGKRALYYQVRGLVERGHKVEVWSLDTASHTFLPLNEFATEHIVSAAAVNHSTPNWFSKRFARNYHSTIARMRSFDDACKRCADEIEAGDFDLLFANGTIQYAMPYIMQHAKIPSVVYLQEPYRYMYEAAPVLPWIGGATDLKQAQLFHPRRFMAEYPNLQTLRLLAKQEWLNARACDQILVNSYFSRESVLRAYGVNAKVCYLGIDTTLFRHLHLERERFIVGLGSFDPIKGIDLAIQAVSLLTEPRPPLVWVANSGSENYRAEMIRLAHSLGVDLRIEMGISDAELVAILNKAALLLYTPRLEPFGFAPLEANACGLPVVAVAEGGIRETVQDGVNGFLVDCEVECLARAVAKILQSPALARELAENGIAHVEQKWNLAASIDRLETMLLEVVARKTNSSKLIRNSRDD
jgi:glycosyltransferase involved in cell wall biosynthesis